MIRSALAAAFACLLCGSVLADSCDSLDDIDWLMGRWDARSEERLTSEHWKRVSEASAEVSGRVFVLPHFEQTFEESIRVTAMAGEVFYLAKVSHNPYPVPFKLTDCSSGTAIFENPTHDFPSRIAYHQLNDHKARADVSGPDGKGFSISFD